MCSQGPVRRQALIGIAVTTSVQENPSISFEPARPSTLEPWQIVLAFILFVCVIAAIVWRLRRRSSQNNPGSLELNRK